MIVFLLRVLAYLGVAAAARRLDRHRFARKYVVAVKAKRRAEFWDRFGRDFWRAVR